eukprot:g28748.t1
MSSPGCGRIEKPRPWWASLRLLARAESSRLLVRAPCESTNEPGVSKPQLWIPELHYTIPSLSARRVQMCSAFGRKTCAV